MIRMTIPRGIYGVALTLSFKNADGSAKDLTGYTGTLKVWIKGQSKTPFVSATLTIDSPSSAGMTHYDIEQGKFDDEGVFRARGYFTKTGANDPSDIFEIEVEESA